MDKTVLRNFQKHLLPISGTGPLVCLQLGVRNPSHVVWLMENVLACTDDRWFGTDDFRGSFTLFKECVDVLGGFTNATVWPYEEHRFLRSIPPKAKAGLRRGVSLVYLDDTRGAGTLGGIFHILMSHLRPGTILVVNGYRTRRRREPQVMETIDSVLNWESTRWERLWDNTQIGVRRI